MPLSNEQHPEDREHAADTPLFIPEDQLSDISYEGPYEVLEEPDDQDRILRAVSALASHPGDALTVEKLIRNGTLAEYAMPLVLGREYSEDNRDGNIGGRRLLYLAQNVLKNPESQNAENDGAPSITWPLPRLLAPAAPLSPEVRRQTMAIIGDGPAGLLMARMRAELGYEPNATVLYSASGKPGGIWNHNRVVNEGHNTFSTAKAFDATLSASGERPGEDLQAFLRQVGNNPVRKMLLKAKVTSARYDTANEGYVITSAGEDGQMTEQRFDSVFVATGNAQPRNLDSRLAPMQTNAHQIERLTIMKRWQEQIPEEKWPAYDGANPLVIGLGNSAMAMIEEFLKMRDAGINVHPLFLTHHSRNALLDPKGIVTGQNGRPEGPLFRTRSNLTRIAGDIGKIDSRYDEALDRGWIMTDVRRWDVRYDGQPVKENLYADIQQGNSRTLSVKNIPMIYALVGYQNNPDFMRQLGCTILDDQGRVDADPLSHRVRPALPDAGRMYIAGNAASHKQDRNQEVIPGIMRVVGEIAFAEIVRGHRRKNVVAQNIGTVRDALPKEFLSAESGSSGIKKEEVFPPLDRKIEVYAVDEIEQIQKNFGDRYRGLLGGE